MQLEKDEDHFQLRMYFNCRAKTPVKWDCFSSSDISFCMVSGTFSKMWLMNDMTSAMEYTEMETKRLSIVAPPGSLYFAYHGHVLKLLLQARSKGCKHSEAQHESNRGAHEMSEERPSDAPATFAAKYMPMMMRARRVTKMRLMTETLSFRIMPWAINDTTIAKTTTPLEATSRPIQSRNAAVPQVSVPDG